MEPREGTARPVAAGHGGGGAWGGAPRRAVAHPTRSYLATRVLTAPPQILVLMLMDGVLREVARALQVDLKAPGGRERLHRALTRAQDFLRELILTLDHARGGELAGRLAALYLFCQERLVEANVKANPRLAGDVVRVLAPIREAWAALCAGGAGTSGGAGGGGGTGPAGVPVTGEGAGPGGQFSRGGPAGGEVRP
ncbi:flagellar export chaperone FliS [Thermaerobacter litoralis]